MIRPRWFLLANERSQSRGIHGQLYGPGMRPRLRIALALVISASIVVGSNFGGIVAAPHHTLYLSEPYSPAIGRIRI
jgi:hypothetical protein